VLEKVKKYLANDNAIIIFDTNVFLNLYEYSPYVSEFFIELISHIKEKVVVTSTVKREFYRNHKNCYHRQKKKFENVPHQLKKSTESTKTKLLKQIDIWEKFKFPNIESLRNLIEERLTGLETAFDEYVEENDIFQEINDNFLNEDKILNLMDELIKSDKLMEEVSVDEIYEICEKGKNRYKIKTPPGFMDDKDKDGVDKYNDLIIWSEVIKYCKENSLDLIFVTDDLKDDWWINNDSMKFEFHPQLVQEFKKETNRDILGLNSYDLFNYISNIIGVVIPDEVAGVLQYSVDGYIKGIFEEYDLDELLLSELQYSEDQYVDTDTLTNYEGSIEFEDEINSLSPLSFSFEGFENDKAIYTVDLEIKIDAITRSYWGKDEDTKEAIYSDTYYSHSLSGNLTVKIIRKVDTYLEDLIHDHSIDEIQIISGNLKEHSSYSSEDLCVECGKNIGQIYFRNQGMVCDNCAVGDENGDICPSCGEKVPHDLMAGNGFCIRCTRENDDL